MKYWILSVFLLVAACSRDASDAGPRAAAAVAAIALQSEARDNKISPAPSAPVELDYRMPASAPAGQPLTIELTLGTPLASGTLEVTVVKQVGATVLSDAVQRIDLAQAARPLQLPLQILPGSGPTRSVVLSVAVEVGGELQSRNFRVLLPADQ